MCSIPFYKNISSKRTLRICYCEEILFFVFPENMSLELEYCKFLGCNYFVEGICCRTECEMIEIARKFSGFYQEEEI